MTGTSAPNQSPPTAAADAPVATSGAPATAETMPGNRADPDAPPAYRWRWIVLAVVLAVEVMDLLDSTIVNVAAPTIRADLSASYTAVQWIVAGYTLAFAVMLVIGGRLGDLVGRRRMFVLGAAGFTISSVLCAVSGSPEMLIAMRVLQGAFGAVMVPQGFGIVKEVFPPEKLAAAFGAFGPVIGLAAVGGPILAGSLISADWFGTGWRMAFLVNVPFGVLAVVGALRFMPRSRPVRGERLDLSGVALLVLASMLLIFPLVQGRDLGWPRWSLVMMVAALLVLAVFVVQQRRRTSSPLITLSLFGRRAYSAGLLVITLFFASLVGLMLVFGLYLQIGLGFSPLRAGLTFAPWALGIAVASALAGAWLANAFGRRTVHGGLIVLAVGLGWLSLTIHQHGTGTSSVALVPALLVCGLGSGLVLSPLFNIILAAVQDDEVGSGSGVLNAVQQFGGAAGVAVLGTVFFSVLAGHAGAVADAQAPALRAAVTAAAPGAPADPVLATYRACLVDRMHADDPDTIPPSCRPRPATAATTSQTAPPTAPGAAEPAAVDSALTAAAGDAVRRDFTHALQVTLMITLATTLLTVLLAFLLPRTARPE